MTERKENTGDQPEQEQVKVTQIKGANLPNEVRRRLRLFVRQARAKEDLSAGDALDQISNILNLDGKN
ncbi:MAG: hypothetical protein PHX93_02900 [Candidatus Peribacteraceae bacterium]|jgi:hypothetical protein|nr:hypothetical protein [Candidatus Peribacteraceae bacterium]